MDERVRFAVLDVCLWATVTLLVWQGEAWTARWAITAVAAMHLAIAIGVWRSRRPPDIERRIVRAAKARLAAIDRGERGIAAGSEVYEATKDSAAAWEAMCDADDKEA